MKKMFFLLVLMIAAQMVAQERSTIVVKSFQVSNGVVVITAAESVAPGQTKMAYELHCNKDAGSCKTVEPGSYLMVRLPKNWGMYDCSNVDLYPSSADPDTAQKIGEYCLIEK